MAMNSGGSSSVRSSSSSSLRSRGSDPAIQAQEMFDVMRTVGGGTWLTRFPRSKRPENRMFQVRLETRELIWSRNIGGKPEGVGEEMIAGFFLVPLGSRANKDLYCVNGSLSAA